MTAKTLGDLIFIVCAFIIFISMKIYYAVKEDDFSITPVFIKVELVIIVILLCLISANLLYNNVDIIVVCE